MGSITSENTTSVLYLDQGSYGLGVTQAVTGRIILFGTVTPPPFRGLKDLHRQLKQEQSTGDLAVTQYTVIYAAPGSRHLILTNGLLQVDSIEFRGAPSAQYSGGIKLIGSGANGDFARTNFIDNRRSSTGCALALQDGAQAHVGK